MLELLAKKIGMTHFFDANGSMISVTIAQVYDNCVIKSEYGEDGCNNLLLAFDKLSTNKTISKPIAGVFNKNSLPLFKKIRQSKVSGDLSFGVGDAISIDSVLKIGDKISVRGTTTGKGFCGVMKRWNFAGLEASHGVSISHRSHGSTGQRQDPGKVFRGKKMAGHMGVEKVTIKNLAIVSINQEKSLIAIKGSVPGYKGSDILLRIARS